MSPETIRELVVWMTVCVLCSAPIGMKPSAKKIEGLKAEIQELTGRRWLGTTARTGGVGSHDRDRARQEDRAGQEGRTHLLAGPARLEDLRRRGAT
jgi:hypothetical protein